MLAVVVADVAGEGEYQFERRKFGANPEQLHALAQWLIQLEVEEVVMESTAQYWKPVWGVLSSLGNRRASSARGGKRCPASFTCARPKAIAVRGGAKTISPTESGWSNGWWLTNWC